MPDTVQQYEREVVQARAKLAHDLATLRNPSTIGSFTASLKNSALEAKDTMVEQATEAVQSKLTGLVEDIKAKAAANPAAALAIGAGIAWHFVRNPPIVTALIGAGIYSLWRTNGVYAGNDSDYLRQGRERLKEQASEFGTKSMEAAAEAGHAISAKAGDVAVSAKETVQNWSDVAKQTLVEAGTAVSDAAKQTLAEAGTAVKEQTDALAWQGRRTMHDVRDQMNGAASRVSSAFEDGRQEAIAAGRDLLAAAPARDTMLLGLAGLAAAAAVGMAYQKRIAETVD